MLVLLGLAILIALMMGAWAFVDSGGKVTFTGFSGLGIENCSLEMRQQMAEAQPHESAYPYRRVQRKEYRISLDGLYDADAPEHLIVALRDTVSVEATYRDANDNILFQGDCIWESAGDAQRGRDFGRHNASLMSDGDPTIG